MVPPKGRWAQVTHRFWSKCLFQFILSAMIRPRITQLRSCSLINYMIILQLHTAGLKITVGYRIISDPFWKVSDTTWFPPDILSDLFFLRKQKYPTHKPVNHLSSAALTKFGKQILQKLRDRSISFLKTNHCIILWNQSYLFFLPWIFKTFPSATAH